MVRFNHVKVINFEKYNCCKGSSFKMSTKKGKREKKREIDETEKCLDKVFPHDSRFFFLESRLVKDNSSSIAPNFSN